MTFPLPPAVQMMLSAAQLQQSQQGRQPLSKRLLQLVLKQNPTKANTSPATFKIVPNNINSKGTVVNRFAALGIQSTKDIVV